MRTIRKETREVEVVEMVICNGCRKEAGVHEEMIRVYHEGGYSSILGDGTSYDFDLCEPCLKKIMDGLQIPPKTDDRW